MARAILESYERQNHIIRRVSLKNRETCRVLLQLKESVALFTAGEIEKALQAIESLDLVPLDGDVVSITRKAEDFKEVDDNIARNFSEILLMTMNILFKVHQGLKESPYGDASRQNVRFNIAASAARSMC